MMKQIGVGILALAVAGCVPGEATIKLSAEDVRRVLRGEVVEVSVHADVKAECPIGELGDPLMYLPDENNAPIRMQVPLSEMNQQMEEIDPNEIAQKPAETAPAAKPAENVRIMHYSVYEGDTLEKIAADLSVTVEDILRYNPHVKGNADLKDGVSLQIPYKD